MSLSQEVGAEGMGNLESGGIFGTTDLNMLPIFRGIFGDIWG